jgi:hypothetical protein
MQNLLLSRKAQSNNFERLDLGDDQVLLLQRKGGLAPVEKAQDLEELGKKRAKLTALSMTAIENYAKSKGLSYDESRELIYPTAPSEVEIDGRAMARGISIEQAKAELTRTGISINLMDYMDSSQREQYLSLAQESERLPIMAATKMIEHRYVHAVRVTSVAVNDVLGVAPLAKELKAGTVLMLDGAALEVAEDTIEGAVRLRVLGTASVAVVDSLLVVLKNGKPEIGLSSWSAHDTEQLLERHISVIHSFYEREVDGVVGSGEQAGNPGTLSDGSGSTVSALPQIGSASTTDSPTSAVAIAG